MSSYPKVYYYKHAWVKDEILLDPVLVEEKIDGSQFSFWVDSKGLHCRSRSAEIDLDNPQKMFEEAVKYVKSIKDLLVKDWIYYGEVLESNKHNVLKYDRFPPHHIIGFDIDTGDQSFLSYEEKQEEFKRIGLITVPKIYYGKLDSIADLEKSLYIPSILGGNIEGFVIKNYFRFGKDKKILAAKIVREEFKEAHREAYKTFTIKDRISSIADKYKTKARWDKAIIHLKELGILQNKPSDIGFLLKEISADVLLECKEDIKEDLFNEFWKDIIKEITKGFPEYYKEKLGEN